VKKELPPFIIVVVPPQVPKGGSAEKILHLYGTNYLLTHVGVDTSNHWFGIHLRSNGRIYVCSDDQIKEIKLEELQTVHKARIFLYQKEEYLSPIFPSVDISPSHSLFLETTSDPSSSLSEEPIPMDLDLSAYTRYSGRYLSYCNLCLVPNGSLTYLSKALDILKTIDHVKYMLDSLPRLYELSSTITF
jgi:hypothetical protein